MMIAWDAFHLARARFAFTVTAHIVFRALSIGLASYVAVLERLWLTTGKRVYRDLADRGGPVIGPLMGYEALSAFFLAAGFLGICGVLARLG